MGQLLFPTSEIIERLQSIPLIESLSIEKESFVNGYAKNKSEYSR